MANPQQVKAVTGHKTDPHDARWLAHLLRHTMIRPSFIPPRPIRELREFTRRRKQMIRIAAGRVDSANAVGWAREDGVPDLCGGESAIIVPTATANNSARLPAWVEGFEKRT